MKGAYRKRRYMAEGYMTVEATLIMPMVLYVCVFIIYTGFFQYDRCLMRQDAYRAALRGSSGYRDSNQEVYNTAYQALENLGTEKYIATTYTYSIAVQKNIVVQIQGNISMPFRAMALLTGTPEWRIEEKAESTCINPVFFIRMCHQLEKERKESTERKEETKNVSDGIHDQF